MMGVPSRHTSFFIALGCAYALAACAAGGDDTSSGPAPDSGGADVTMRDGNIDSSKDTGAPDSVGSTDGTSGADVVGSDDGGGGGLDVADSAVAETSLDDTSVADTSIVDTSMVETSMAEASMADTSGSEGGDAGADVVDASVSDASDEAVDAADGAACVTMWPAGGTNSVTNPTFESTTNPTAGWAARFGGGSIVASTMAHCGAYSGETTGRTQPYQAIGTAVATAAGAYTVALWVMQDSAMGNLQLTIQGYGACGGADAGSTYYNVGFPTIAANTWTFFTGTLTVPANCTSMFLVVSQDNAQGLTMPFPDIFLDDVFVGQ
jgi:hypothetical protein